jgi:hypothetical protein
MKKILSIFFCLVVVFQFEVTAQIGEEITINTTSSLRNNVSDTLIITSSTLNNLNWGGSGPFYYQLYTLSEEQYHTVGGGSANQLSELSEIATIFSPKKTDNYNYTYIVTIVLL